MLMISLLEGLGNQLRLTVYERGTGLGMLKSRRRVMRVWVAMMMMKMRRIVRMKKRK